VRRFRRDLQRLYIYNFFGDDCRGRFDAGIVKSNSDPTPRPAYNRVRRQLRNFKREPTRAAARGTRAPTPARRRG
jgi:hypothetical protein